MTQFTINIAIDAPVAVVFDAISNVENFPNTVPEIRKTEFVTARKRGVGTVFRETRLMGGSKEIVTELEVTEYEPDHRVRMVNETHGTVWDTTMTVHPEGEGTRLELTMDATAKNVLPRMMNRVLRRTIHKAVAKHYGHVKAYCEGKAASG